VRNIILVILIYKLVGFCWMVPYNKIPTIRVVANLVYRWIIMQLRKETIFASLNESTNKALQLP